MTLVWKVRILRLLRLGDGKVPEKEALGAHWTGAGIEQHVRSIPAFDSSVEEILNLEA